MEDIYRLLKGDFASTKLSYYHQTDQRPLEALTIGLLLEKSAAKYGDSNAIISLHQNLKLTFRDILNQSDILAAGLSKLGMNKGDRLGLWFPNSVEWLITWMACARLGVVVVAINPFYEAPEIEFCINKVGIKAMLCQLKHKEKNYYELLGQVVPELFECEPGKLDSCKVPTLKTIIVCTEENLRGVYKYSEIMDLADENTITNIRDTQFLIKPEDTCMIQFTSGSTGQPKAALQTHFTLANFAFYTGKRNEFNTHHKVCLQAPLFHALGSTVLMLPALYHGTTVVLPSGSYSPERTLEALAKEKCTIVCGTPTMFVDLTSCQEKSKKEIALEIAISAGATASSSLFDKIQEVLKVKTLKQVYGLTETMGACFSAVPGDDNTKAIVSVGRLESHLEAKVIDTKGYMVPMGTPGELCIRGYCNISGYWDDEEKTKELIGKDGWLRTGDQFVLMEDGYGQLVGRFKDIIIRGGENISPKEIENVLDSHPDVLESHVIGIPNERLGEEVCACVRVKKGTLTSEEVKNFCKGKIARFKIPSRMRFFEEFPKTASGKVQLFKLAELVKET